MRCHVFILLPFCALSLSLSLSWLMLHALCEDELVQVVFFFSPSSLSLPLSSVPSPLNFCSSNSTLSSTVKAFGIYVSDDPRKETVSYERLKVIMKHESIENIMERIISCSAIFFAFQPLSIDWVVINDWRRWAAIVDCARKRKRSDNVFVCVDCLFAQMSRAKSVNGNDKYSSMSSSYQKLSDQ